MKKPFLFLLFFLFCVPVLFSQVHSGLSYFTNCKQDINRLPSFIDSTNNILYVGGYYDTISGSLRSNIAAFDIKTGLLKAWLPLVNGKINALIKIGNLLYVGGSFTQVNGQSRSNLAAIDVTTGNVLWWSPNPNNEVLSLAADNNYLYIGGRFSQISAVSRNFLAVYNLNTHAILSWPSALDPAWLFFDNVKVNGNKVYGMSENILGYNSINELEFSTGNIIEKVKANGGVIHDYLLYNNKIYCVGNFTTINDSLRKYVSSVNISGAAVQAWNPAHISNSSPAFFRIENYRDTLFIGSRGVSGIDTAHNYIKKFSSSGNGSFLNVFKYYISSGNYLNDLAITGDKLVEASLIECNPAEFRKNKIDLYCFRPNQPQAFSVYSQSVCAGQNEVAYAIPAVQGFVNYEWTYTGSGATITGNTNSITIDFSLGATSGILKVKGINKCSLKSDERQLNITVNPLPDVNAGNDDSLTCINTSVLLQGTSVTPGITYFWQGPSGTATSAQLNTTIGGTYVLSVTNISTGCIKKDTAFVVIDTLRPAFISLPDRDTLNCFYPSKILNGVTINANDSLRWQTPIGSSPDPCTINTPGTYLCIAINRVNGCTTTDSVIIIKEERYLEANTFYPDSVINCNTDSISLFGYTNDPVAYLKWITPAGDSLVNNPLYAKVSGWYTLYIQDFFTGCVTTKSVFIDSDTISPVLSSVPDSTLLTCSFPSAVLNAFVYPSHSLLTWQGPQGNMPNPALAQVTGKYIIQAVDTLNGCTSKDSVNVFYKPYLAVNAGNDTLICNASTAILTANVINGTAAYTFNWNNGLGALQSLFVTPNDTVNYIIAVTDGAGCYGSDTITVFTAPQISDSIVTFMPCAEQGIGEIQVFAKGGIVPYIYSINNGFTFQADPVFDSVVSGNYIVTIRDSLGCYKTDTAYVDSSSFQPSVNFLVSTHSFLNDTLVLVDISNPRPDTVTWEFPFGVQVINDDPFSPVIVKGDTGAFSIKMKVYYGDCVLETEKQINIFDFDSLSANGYNSNGIESIFISPNPNAGNFNVAVKLFAKQTFVVFIYDARGIEKFRRTIYENDTYSENITLDNPAPGSFVLIVVAEYDSKSKTIIVTE